MLKEINGAGLSTVTTNNSCYRTLPKCWKVTWQKSALIREGVFLIFNKIQYMTFELRLHSSFLKSHFIHTID